MVGKLGLGPFVVRYLGDLIEAVVQYQGSAGVLHTRNDLVHLPRVG